MIDRITSAVMVLLCCAAIDPATVTAQVASPPALPVSTSPTFGSIAGSATPDGRVIGEVLQRLEAAEAELQQFRAERGAPGHPQCTSSQLQDDRTVSHTGFTVKESATPPGSLVSYEADELTSACPDAESFCQQCKEKLSWNKGDWRIVPFGMLRGEAIWSGVPTSADATIFFLNPTQQGVTDDSFIVHGKTSMLNFAITGPSVRGFETGGMILINFTGAQPLRNMSGPNILNAYGEVKGDCVRFAFGRMYDLFGPIAPNTVNIGQQRGAGNIGIFRGAIHLDRYVTLSDSQKWTLSARISQGDVSDYLLIPQVRGKDNGWPNVEVRVGVELGTLREDVRPVEIGVSGLIGETQAVADEALDPQGIFLPALDDVSLTWGVCLDFQLQGDVFGAIGEVWTGQAAGTYFMASLQSLNPNAQGSGIPSPIRSVGGWGEVYMRPWNRWTFHVGFGIDDPNNNDVGFVTPTGTVGQIRLNQVAWWNVKWDIFEFFELGFEVSHRKTHFVNPNNASDTMLYHFSSTLKY